MKVNRLKDLITKLGGDCTGVQTVDQAIERLCACEIGGGGGGGVTKLYLVYEGDDETAYLCKEFNPDTEMGDPNTKVTVDELDRMLTTSSVLIYVEIDSCALPVTYNNYDGVYGSLSRLVTNSNGEVAFNRMYTAGYGGR